LIASLRQIDAFHVPAAFLRLLAAGVVDQNPPHRLGSRSKEVAAAIPVLRLLNIHQPKVRLVDQGRGLQGLARLFLGQLLRRQLA
jgi:hypothetical protein